MVWRWPVLNSGGRTRRHDGLEREGAMMRPVALNSLMQGVIVISWNN